MYTIEQDFLYTQYTVWQRRFVHIYIASSYIIVDKTSWTHIYGKGIMMFYETFWDTLYELKKNYDYA